MKNEIKISLRNLLHNNRRTLLTLSILVLGVCAMMIYAGYMDYSMWGYRESTIRGGLGHFQVYREGYSDRGNSSHLDFLMEDEREIYREIMKTPHVDAVTPVLSLEGLLSSGESTLVTLCNGYDPAAVEEMTSSFSLEEGSFFEGSDEYQIIIGRGLAKKLNTGVGDLLTIMTTTHGGALNAVDVTVAGIVNTSVKEYDNMLSIIPVGLAKSLLDVEGVEKFIVMVDDTDLAPATMIDFEKRYRAAGIKVEQKRWQDLATYYMKVKKMYESYFIVTQIIIFVIVAFSIVNTMSMIILERMREIGTIRAIGMDRFGVIKMFLCESFLLSIIGAATGFLLFRIISTVINVTGGIYTPPPPGQSDGYYALIQAQSFRYVQVFFIIVVSVVGGSIIPSVRAAWTGIDKALRYV